MTQLRLMLNGALLTLIFLLVVTLTVLVMSEMQIVQADTVAQPVAPAQTDTTPYARLTDAPPQRDLTTQRFAPVEVTQ